MDQHTINRLGQIRQQEILQSAAVQGEVELQPWLKAVRSVLGIIWRQSNDLAARIDAAEEQPCGPIQREQARS